MSDQPPEIPTVDVTEARDKAASGAILIDVREQIEWDESRISGAELKPLSTVNSWYEDLPDEGDIVFYCRSGNRSGQIVEALVTKVGMKNVFNMAGGIIAWAENDLPLET